MAKRTLPLNCTPSRTLLSTRYFSSNTGHCASQMLVVWPIASHSSSAICGAKGARSTVKGSRMARAWHFCWLSSLHATMKADMLVLYENSSISVLTFLISLCRLLRLSAVGSLSSACRAPSLLQKSDQNFFRKRWQPSMPLVSQGFDCSTGPRNIS